MKLEPRIAWLERHNNNRRIRYLWRDIGQSAENVLTKWKTENPDSTDSVVLIGWQE